MACSPPGLAGCRHGGFELLSSAPLAYAWHGFASACECQCLVKAGTRLQQIIDENLDPELSGTLRRHGVAHGLPGFRRAYLLPGSRKLRAEFDHEAEAELGDGCALLRRFEADVGEFVGCPAHEAEDSCILNVTPGRSDKTALEHGLHVDTFNDEPRRFATAILYLTDLDSTQGGHTLFPLAAGAPASAVAAGEALLRAGVESTDAIAELETDGAATFAAAEVLEAHATALALSARRAVPTAGSALAAPAEALALSPRCGSLLVFFTRGRDGRVDNRAWHGSAAVVAGTSKWTLQTFKAAPPGQDPEAFGAERASAHFFAARRAFPPVAFRAFRVVTVSQREPDDARLVIGAQQLIEERVALPGGISVHVLSAHSIAGPLHEGCGHGDLTGLVLWPASALLAVHVAAHPSLVGGQRVLDLGCGCGFLGLVASALGACETVLLDASPVAAALAQRNVRHNGHSTVASVVRRSWRDDLGDLGAFGAVLAGDVLYPGRAGTEGAAAEELLRALRALLAPGGQALLAVQCRDGAAAASLGRAAAAAGLSAESAEGWCTLPSLLLWRLACRGPAGGVPGGTLDLSELD